MTARSSILPFEAASGAGCGFFYPPEHENRGAIAAISGEMHFLSVCREKNKYPTGSVDELLNTLWKSPRRDISHWVNS